MPTIGQIRETGKSLNQGDVFSDALLQRLYDLRSDCREKKIPLPERKCYEELRKESKKILEEALAKAADSISTTIENASYFHWERINRF